MKSLTVEWLAKELLLYDKEWMAFANEDKRNNPYHIPSLDSEDDLIEYVCKAKDVFELKQQLPNSIIEKALEEDIELPNFVYNVIEEIKDLADFIKNEHIYKDDNKYFNRLKKKYEVIYMNIKTLLN